MFRIILFLVVGFVFSNDFIIFQSLNSSTKIYKYKKAPKTPYVTSENFSYFHLVLENKLNKQTARQIEGC